MKRIVIAPDSFKECLGAAEVAEAIATGFRKVFPRAEIVKVPLSDGGEGLVNTLVTATHGRIVPCEVTGPTGRKVKAFLGVLGDEKTAVIEMAAASGLHLIPPSERNPLITTTYGTGELIKRALDLGCTRIIVGVGGSATNDGGAGMAQALGARLLGADGKEICAGAAGLRSLEKIDTSNLDPRLKEVSVVVAVDVDNPLCGPNGASYVYGPQKGATPEMLPVLDESLRRFAFILQRDIGVNILNVPGAGAAGGLGGGLMAFLGAQLRSGIEVVLEVVRFEAILQKGADLVVTGEGQLDRQTSFGKVPIGVSKVAKKFGIPVLAIVGAIGEGAEVVFEQGIDSYFSVTPRPMTLEESIGEVRILLKSVAERCARMIKAFL
ncbi:MAG: Glycerate kinase [Thermoanaerobacterales bacterium 50_218]|nr:MAG: Glycerate kinase [Thermoanaerobacterales bacterium 50_218]HAA89150.1 glycerate kinase [Peptococcaceae bacterium]